MNHFQFSSVQFSRSVMSDSLWTHELKHTRLPCPSSTPGVHPNPCPSSQWCHPVISSSVVPFSCPQYPPSIRVFSNESTLRMRWPKYWSFSFSIIPSKEIPGLISFRMDWLDLLAVQGTLKSLLQHHSSKLLFVKTVSYTTYNFSLCISLKSMFKIFWGQSLKLLLCFFHCYIIFLIWIYYIYLAIPGLIELPWWLRQ